MYDDSGNYVSGGSGKVEGLLSFPAHQRGCAARGHFRVVSSFHIEHSLTVHCQRSTSTLAPIALDVSGQEVDRGMPCKLLHTVSLIISN
jgi:hypothetical protein